MNHGSIVAYLHSLCCCRDTRTLETWYPALNTLLLFPDGDIGVAGTVKDAYMKQKHRLIWERRHGPVGSGQNTSEAQ